MIATIVDGDLFPYMNFKSVINPIEIDPTKPPNSLNDETLAYCCESKLY